MDTVIAIGEPAPDFHLSDLNGKTHSLGDYRGRIVLLNFWSAECSWAERADLELLSCLRQWGERVAALWIAVNAYETREMRVQVALQRGLSPVLQDAQQMVANLYGASNTPHFFVVDGLGILRYQGAYDDVTFRQRTATRGYLREAVEALLAGKEPDVSHTAAYGCAIVRHTLSL